MHRGSSCGVWTRQFSSAREQLRQENAARLRALRKKNQQQKNNDGNRSTDYRFRASSQQPAGSSVSELWGHKAREEEEERQRKNLERKEFTASGVTRKRTSKKKFVPFFEEVDALMEERRREKASSSLTSFLDSLGDATDNDNRERESSSIWRDAAAITSSSSSSSTSIFDAFPIPEPLPPPNPNAFDEEAFNEYRTIIEEVLESQRFTNKHKRKPLSEEFISPIAKWLTLDEKYTDYSLPALDTALRDGVALDPKEAQQQTESVRQQLTWQREAFLAQTGWTEPQYAKALGGLSVLGDFCAKKSRAAPLRVAWEKVKEAGMVPEQRMMDTFLYIATSAAGGWALSKRRSFSFSGSDRPLGSVLDILNLNDEEKGITENNSDIPPEEIDLQEVDIPEEIAAFHDLLYEPTEKTVSLRVKSLVSKGNAKGAEALLDSFSAEQSEPKLRTYLPILRLYCEQGDISSALALFKRMRDTQSVLLEPETYVQVIAAVAENRVFNQESPPISGAEDLGYSPSSGPALFDQLASEMAEDVLEISSASARRLYNALSTAFKGDKMSNKLKDLHILAPLPPENKRAGKDELVVSKVTVDSETAVCPRTGAALRLITLEEKQRRQLHNSLLKLSTTQFERFGGREQDVEYAAKQLSLFAEWLDTRDGHPFTAIVDGANVAYYMQNFEQGKFNYHQIQFMVDALEKMNENPLVIIPYKYLTPAFRVTTGASSSKQVLTSDDRSIIDSLFKSGKLYQVPPRCLDDYYWMLASVSIQANSTKGLDLSVFPNNEHGRWPGTRPMLVTNDQMRDHKLELLEPRLYRRWYSCHIVNYNFTAFVDDECVDREIGFSTADFYSREIQGNPSPANNGSESGAGTAWHFPVSDWDLDDRFCVRLPR